MKFGFYGLHRGSSVDPDRLESRARRIEDAGFDAIWVGDHVALPHEPTDPPAEPRLEALAVLAYLAAVTERVRLCVGVVVMPQRQPVLLAKQLATIDVLSGGRLTFGLGVGYVEPELRALGATLADRGAMTDEFVAAVLALWREQAPDFDGRWVRFSGVTQEPRPVQRPHPPIVVGGYSTAAFERAARVGGGWFGWDLDVDETVDALEGLAAARSRLGGTDADRRLEITVKPKEPVTPELVAQFADVGVDQLILHPESTTDVAVDDFITITAETLVGADR